MVTEIDVSPDPQPRVIPESDRWKVGRLVFQLLVIAASGAVVGLLLSELHAWARN